MRTITAAAALLLCLGTAQAATTVQLDYKGISQFGPPVDVTGTGAFTIRDGIQSGPIGLDDLLSFAFSFSYSLGGRTDSFSYTLADLSCQPAFGRPCGFGADLGAKGIDALFIQTDVQAAQYNWGQSLTVMGLDEAYTTNPDMPPLSAGTISATLQPDNKPVPEPASLALVGAALAAGLLRRRRSA